GDLGPQRLDLARERLELAPRRAASLVAARDPREVVPVEAPLARLEPRDAEPVPGRVLEALLERRVTEPGRVADLPRREPPLLVRPLPRDTVGHGQPPRAGSQTPSPRLRGEGRGGA